MNETIRPFLYRTQLVDRDLFLWNYIQVEYLTSGRVYNAIVALFCVLAVGVSSFLLVRALQHPPMHINPCLITAYDVIVTVISNGTRVGQILFESGVIEGGKEPLSTPCVVLGFLRFYGLISVTRFSVIIFMERCLALRHVRDYERNRRIHIAILIILLDIVVNTAIVVLLMMDYLSYYKVGWVVFIFYFGVYFAFNRLLAQNEKRLERLNRRIIKRPSIQGGLGKLPKQSVIKKPSVQEGLGKLPKKFFGDSAKDMYTLSLRLQLDENIWCCRQLSRGSHIFVIGLTAITLIEIVPPIFSYTRETIGTLMILMAIGNLVIPIGTIVMHCLICWSLDKLRPLIVPSCINAWHERRRMREMKRSRRVTFETQIAPDSDSRYSRETNEYFGQLSNQWDASFESVYI